LSPHRQSKLLPKLKFVVATVPRDFRDNSTEECDVFKIIILALNMWLVKVK
jgi:hypothetical protein